MTSKAVPATADPAPQTEHRSRSVVLAVILSAVFMQLLDSTITMVAVPSIQTSLRTAYGQVQLVVALYMLAFACVLVTGGRLGDTYGRKKIFLIGMAGFTLASAVCGLAPNALTLIGARVFQGMSSGLMFPQVLGIIQATFSKTQRTKAITLYGAIIGLATILGPVTGGALIDLNLAGSGWRSIFYVNVPIGLAALALGLAMIPESRSERPGRLDLAGASLLGAGLFLLVLPLVIGRDDNWPTWSYVCMAISPFLLTGFFAYEQARTRREADPLINTTLFRQRPFTLGLLACLIFFSGVPSFFMILLITLQGGLGYSPVRAGSVTLGFALALAVGSARSAAVAQRLGSRILVVGCVLVLLGQASVIAVMYWQGTAMVGWHLLLPMFVAGIGGGLFLAPVTNVVLAGVPVNDAGSASGALATAQQVGAAVGVAVVGVIFFGLIGHDAVAASDSALPQLRSDLSALSVPTSAQQRIVDSFQTCFHDRANATDPTSVPASCAAAEQSMAGSPMAEPIKGKVAVAIQEKATPAARRYSLEHSMRTTLDWHLAVFTATLLLVARLPKVRLESDALLPGGA